MSAAPIIAFFNNKGGVGKTSLVYHLAWMYADFGERVLAVDLDPQANLTAAFLEEDRLEELWPEGESTDTVYGALVPLVEGTGDIREPHVEVIRREAALFDHLGLVVGDLSLSRYEDQLSENWPKAMDGDVRAFRVLSAFWRLIQAGARRHEASVVLVDLGPNLGAMNRGALISSDAVVVPLSPDLFSLQGLRNLGPTLRTWRRQWGERRERNPNRSLEIPEARMLPLGYIVLQHSVRLDRPVKAYDRWIRRIPSIYRQFVLDEGAGDDVSVEDDPQCLALLKHYRSLMPLAQEARKPMFHLKPADGAIGAHVEAVHAAYVDFAKLAVAIRERADARLTASGHSGPQA